MIYSKEKIEEIIIFVRLNLYNRGEVYGAKVIRKELENLNINPLPSLSFISNVLKWKGLTYRRTGHYY